MRKTTIGLLITLASLLVIVGIGYGVFLYQKQLNKEMAVKREAAKKVESLTIAFPYDFQGFYPEAPNEIVTYNYYYHYYEALTAFNKNLEVIPQLAESWENPNESTWRFRLRKDVTFHNGQKMTADDVVASFELAIGNENISPSIPNVQSVVKVDEATVDVKTSSATPILANTLTQVFVLPKSLIEKKDWSHPVGTGPYSFVSSESSIHKFTRYEKYYGPKSKVHNLTIKTIADDEARLTALKNGEIDVMEEAAPVPADTKSNDGKPIKSAVSEPIDANFIIVDSVRSKSPYVKGVTQNPLKDVRVRTAMGLALDVPALINSGDFDVVDKQASQIVPTSIFGYNPVIKPLKQDPVKAKALMKEAGYEKGFTITFDTMNTQELFPEMLKKQLAEIGIIMVINRVGQDEAGFDKLINGDSSMMILSWLCLTGDALEAYENVLSSGSFNVFKIKDPTIEDLVAKAKAAPNLTERKQYLKDLATYVDQQKLIIPLLSEVAVYDYHAGLVLTPRADGMTFAFETSGTVPENLEDYSYLGTVKKILHLT